MAVKRSRLQRKREKESLRQASKYLFLVFVLLFLLIRFGLPALVNLAAFLGNLRQSSEPIEQTDTLAPLPPRLNSLPEATTSATLTVAGFAEAGSEIQLFLRGISAADTIVNNEGEFQFEAVHLREGQNEVYALAKDGAGNTSQPSDSWTVTVDTEDPELTIESPSDGEEFFDNDSPITVTGSTDEGASVTVNEHFARVASDGNFETMLGLKEGDNEIKVVATDKAGNQTSLTIKVSYNP